VTRSLTYCTVKPSSVQSYFLWLPLLCWSPGTPSSACLQNPFRREPKLR
jgi:hypothetical protein